MPARDGAAQWRGVAGLDRALARRMLFVTGAALSASARSFLDDTGCGSLDKPFAPRELLEQVRALLAT